MTIVCVPADDKGNKLWLKELEFDKNKIFIKYKSTYNDIPFMKTEIFAIDNGENYVITGDDGTILYRFNKYWLDLLKN
jgi:hypothetical protein